MKIDLRSDTITKPTPEMLEYMFQAKVGDDVYEEDETVNELQRKTADLFGMEESLFCPSGTMTNQIGIKILTQPQDEVICYKGAHIYKYEGGGLAFNSQVSTRLIDVENGRLSPENILDNINTENVHFPRTTLVALENTTNMGGGSVYRLSEIAKISEVCKAHTLNLHLDGARVFNALVASNENANEYGKYFDTISVCLSKGLGCPVGSLLIGSKALIQKAKRVRKVLGGGMRQAGYLAAAGIYALDHHINRLAEDHQRAKDIAFELGAKSFITYIFPIESNIVLFKLSDALMTDKFLGYLTENNILVSRMGKNLIRFVTHLDFTDSMLEILIQKIRNY